MAIGQFMPMVVSGGGPLSLEYRGVYNDTVDRSAYTFGNVDLGEPSSGRYVAIAIAARAASTRTISSVTIGGVVAQIHAYQFVGTELTAFAVANVPAGATGAVVVSFSGTVVNCSIASYSMAGVKNAMPFDVVTSSGGLSGGAAINVPDGGCVIGVSLSARSGSSWRSSFASRQGLPAETGMAIGWVVNPTSITWNGLIEDALQLQESAAASVNVYRASVISMR